MKIAFWIVTGIFCLMMLASAVFEVVAFNESVTFLAQLGFPKFIAYVLPVTKFLGAVAILTNYSKTLKEWAYAGFFFDFVLAALAHYFSGVPSSIPAIVAIVLLFTSYFLDKKVRP
jgi:magnesium-transporting ATPase (P-type)